MRRHAHYFSSQLGSRNGSTRGNRYDGRRTCRRRHLMRWYVKVDHYHSNVCIRYDCSSAGRRCREGRMSGGVDRVRLRGSRLFTFRRDFTLSRSVHHFRIQVVRVGRVQWYRDMGLRSAQCSRRCKPRGSVGHLRRRGTRNFRRLIFGQFRRVTQQGQYAIRRVRVAPLIPRLRKTSSRHRSSQGSSVRDHLRE